jgi:hypothetical protein
VIVLKQKYYSIEESETQSKQLQADLIHETNSGVIVKDAAHLKEVLEELCAEFETNGKIACESVGSALRPFGRLRASLCFSYRKKTPVILCVYRRRLNRFNMNDLIVLKDYQIKIFLFLHLNQLFIRFFQAL